MNLDDEVVYRIDRSILEELSREKLFPVPAPWHISVDEVAWQKWHKYVTNVIDIDQRKVIWNCDGRGKQTMDVFFGDLGVEKSNQLRAAASDGARGYLSLIKQHAKNALIVLDHFHVKSYLNDAVDSVRKEELRKARQGKNTELADLLHCRKRFILMQGSRQSDSALFSINSLSLTILSTGPCCSKNSFSKSTELVPAKPPRPVSDSGSVKPLPPEYRHLWNWD